MESPEVSSSERHRNELHGHDLPWANNHAQLLVDQAWACHEGEQAAQLVAQQPHLHPLMTIEAGVTTRTVGVPCLVPILRNERLPQYYECPWKVPNYTAVNPHRLGLRAMRWP